MRSDAAKVPDAGTTMYVAIAATDSMNSAMAESVSP